MIGYINEWDGRMDYTVPDGHVITTVKSEHDNRKEDRSNSLYFQALCLYTLLSLYKGSLQKKEIKVKSDFSHPLDLFLKKRLFAP